MRVRKSSWHYRLVKSMYTFESRISTNLCTYFWQVAGGVVFFFFIFLASLSITLFMTAVPVAWWVFGYEPWAQAGLTATIVWVSILAAVSMFLIYAGGCRLRQNAQEREPTVVGAYVRAKKAKICPILEFTDDGH